VTTSWEGWARLRRALWQPPRPHGEQPRERVVGPLELFYDLTSEEPSQELHGRDSLAPVFDDLNQYVATMHFNGQSTISLAGDQATGESYCLAHHLSVAADGQRTLMVASIRYLDEFVKQNGQWLFSERRLMVNWIDTRPSQA
jgi:hypothetical protein